MKERFFSFLLTIGLFGCSNITTAENLNNWIADDGEIELTPEYTVQHVQGLPYSDVYAAFTSMPHKKMVKLRAGDAIAANGHTLDGMNDPKGYYYRARIPVMEGFVTLTLTRSGRIMTHVFELPVLGINVSELPRIYRPYETVRMPVRYLEPPAHVLRDTYNLPIYGPVLRFTLDSVKHREDNHYQFDRLPNIQNGKIVFNHITERAPPPGVYRAEIYRQHHVALAKMSNASRTGWATLSNTIPFTIEVREASVPKD